MGTVVGLSYGDRVLRSISHGDPQMPWPSTVQLVQEIQTISLDIPLGRFNRRSFGFDRRQKDPSILPL